VPPTPPNVKSNKTTATVKKETTTNTNTPLLSDNRDMNNLLLNNLDKFSVEALMMKQENFPAALTLEQSLNDINNDASIAQLGLQQTFQNLKNLFVNYSLNNVSN
jgi:hypothetical protein